MPPLLPHSAPLSYSTILLRPTPTPPFLASLLFPPRTPSLNLNTPYPQERLPAPLLAAALPPSLSRSPSSPSPPDREHLPASPRRLFALLPSPPPPLPPPPPPPPPAHSSTPFSLLHPPSLLPPPPSHSHRRHQAVEVHVVFALHDNAVVGTRCNQ